MKTLIATLALLCAVVLLPAVSHARACVSVLPGDYDDCSIRRGSREPASWCGGNGAGGRASVPRPVVKPEIKPEAARATAGVEAVSWGQVKASLAGR